MKVVGTMLGRAYYATTKEKQTEINKNSDHVIASKPGKRLFGNASILKKPKMVDINVPTHNWWMIVDKLTQIKFSFFIQRRI